MYLSWPSSVSNSCDKDEGNAAVTDYRRLMPRTEQKAILLLVTQGITSQSGMNHALLPEPEEWI